MSVGPSEIVDHGLRPGNTGRRRQSEDCAELGRAADIGGTVKRAILTDYQSCIGLSTVGVARETVQYLVGGGLRGADAGYEKRQRG